MNRWKSLMSVVTTVCIIMASPVNAAAALSDYDADTAARLQDNKLEFDELYNLIKEYNPTMLNQYQQVNDILFDQAVVNEGFQSEKDELNSNIEDLKEQRKDLKRSAKENNLENTESYKTALATLDAMIDAMEAGKKALGKGRSDYNKPVNKGVKRAERGFDLGIRTITQNVQKLMISYDNIVATQAMMEKTKELQQAALEASRLQEQLGLATDTSVLSSQADIYGLEMNIKKVEKSADLLRSNLCLLTGWPADARPEIGHVPAADVSRIAAMNLEADIKKAIGNNQTLIDQRRASSDKSTSGINNRLRNIDDAEQRLQVEMERLYNEVQVKKVTYDAAMIAYEKAGISKESADRKYQMKMISEIQKLMAEMEFAQAEMERKSADTALLQAILDYEWAVQGFVAIPE